MATWPPRCRASASAKGWDSGQGKPTMRLAFTFGTRPEAVKLAPVIREAGHRSGVEPLLVCTGQHRELLRPVLELFSLQPAHDLALMTEGQSLGGLTGRAVEALSDLFGRVRPDAVVVQGDTTTVLCAALAAFYHRIPVAHVEAGLRTDSRYSPFPEEMNRRLAAQLATWHLAPTMKAKEALLAESVQRLGGRIHVTGNTGIDALFLGLELAREHQPPAGALGETMALLEREPDRRLVLVTGHRRESFGEPLAQVCRALRRIAEAHPEALLVYPVHLNPNVEGPVREALGGLENARLTPPAGYADFIRLMKRSHLIITDSGGVQEEAPALGKPVLVTRETTERPEAVEAGGVVLVGQDEERLYEGAHRLLTDEPFHRRMAVPRFPYGDGRAAGRCLDAMLGLPVEEFAPGPAG